MSLQIELSFTLASELVTSVCPEDFDDFALVANDQRNTRRKNPGGGVGLGLNALAGTLIGTAYPALLACMEWLLPQVAKAAGQTVENVAGQWLSRIVASDKKASDQDITLSNEAITGLVQAAVELARNRGLPGSALGELEALLLRRIFLRS